MSYAHKKSVALLCLHRIPEVLDNLSTQLQQTKPTPVGGSVVASFWVDSESVQVSGNPE